MDKGLLFTYGLTYGGAVVSLFRPFVGLLIYVCFAIVRPQAMWFWSVPPGNYSRIIAVALLVGWAGQGFGSWQLGRSKATVLAALGFGAWATFSAALAPNQNVAWIYVENLFTILLPFVVGVTTIDSVAKLKQLTWVIVLSQGYVAYELNLTYFLDGYNRIWEEGYGNLDNNGMAAAFDSCIGMGFYLGVYADKWWKRVVAFAMTGFMIHCVLLSFSRGGMLGLVVTGLVAFFMTPKRASHYVILALAVLATVGLAGKEVRERFGSIFVNEEERDGSAQGRLALWSGCLNLMANHPITGAGPDHWPIMAPLYGFYSGKQAHTTWLRVAAEMGIPGVACFMIFHWLCPLRLWKLARERASGEDPWLQCLARAVIASAVGFAVSAQFVSCELVETSYYVVLLGAGVLKLSSLADRNEWYQGSLHEQEYDPTTYESAIDEQPQP
jgi:probable O-glycosylation ligase (exosortase A-associated)